jgi:hypothetical protein
MIWMTDEEVTELINSVSDSDKPRSRVAITRWRNKARHPKYEERIEIEDKLGMPFEVFHKDIDFDILIDKLERQLKAVKKLKIEKRVREEMGKE